MTPLEFLWMSIAVTLIALAADRLIRRRRRRALAELARHWRMHYSPRDVFHLADRVAQGFPVPGAAAMRVTDLIYGIEGEFHRYIFSTEFTLGVVRSKKRIRRVASFRESRARTDPTQPPALEMTDDALPVFEQYKKLHETHARESDETKSDGAAPATPSEKR